MSDIRSCLSSVISSAGFRGKDTSLSQKTHTLYFYKNMDKTSFFLIFSQSLKKEKKEKCARCILFSSLNHKTFVQKEALEVTECKGLNKNVFLQCQLIWVTFPL